MLRRTIWLVGAAGAVLATACSGPARQAPPPAAAASAEAADYPVTLRFDGGYAFIRSAQQRSLTVASFHAAGEPDSSIASHQLHLRLEVGDQQKGPAPDLAQRTWNLADKSYDIAVAGYGATPAGVQFPPARGFDPKDPCKPIDENSEDANNLSLMPVMGDLAKAAGFDGTLDPTRSKYHNRVIVTSGTMRIVKATSCFEFQSGGRTFDRHRLPNGLAGVIVTFRMKGNLTLNVTDDSGATTPYEFAPAVNQATGARELDLWFGRFPPPCTADEPGCTVRRDQELVDFGRYFQLLKSAPLKATPVVLINRSDAGDVTPRSQCGGIWFDVS